MVRRNEIGITITLRDLVSKSLRQVSARTKSSFNSIQTAGSRATRSLTSSFDRFRGSISLVRVAISGLAVVVARDLIKAYQTQEISEARLGSLIRSNTGATKEQIEALKNQARQLQRVGVVGDEVTISLQSQLASFGANFDQIMQLTPAFVDLLVANKGLNGTTQDAIALANLYGYAIRGQVGRLELVGVQFRESEKQLIANGNETERLNALIGALERNYGGLSEILAKTSAGALKQAQNDFGDLKEVLGFVIIEGIEPLIDAFRGLDGGIDTTSKNVKVAVGSIQFFINALRSGVIGLQTIGDLGANISLNISKGLAIRRGDTEKLIEITEKQEALEERLVDRGKDLIQIWDDWADGLNEVTELTEDQEDALAKLNRTTEDNTELTDKQKRALEELERTYKSINSSIESTRGRLLSLQRTERDIERDRQRNATEPQERIRERIVEEREAIAKEREDLFENTRISAKQRQTELDDLDRRRDSVRSLVDELNISEQDLQRTQERINRPEVERDVRQILEDQAETSRNLIEREEVFLENKLKAVREIRDIEKTITAEKEKQMRIDTSPRRTTVVRSSDRGRSGGGGGRGSSPLSVGGTYSAPVYNPSKYIPRRS